MSDEAMKAHLVAALGIAIERERERVDTLLAEMDKDIQDEVRAMRPVIEALRVLEDQCRDVPGLSIDPAPHGHMALVHGRERFSSHHLSIRPAGSHVFRIEERGSGPPEPYSLNKDVSSPAEVIQNVIQFIARHIDSVRRHPLEES